MRSLISKRALLLAACVLLFGSASNAANDQGQLNAQEQKVIDYLVNCSIQFGANLTSAAPGSVQRTYLIVSDIEAVRNALIETGIDVSEIFHLGPNGFLGGPDPEHGTYRTLATFNDPDGNSWLLQEITARLWYAAYMAAEQAGTELPT